jgi:hypothetical protein
LLTQGQNLPLWQILQNRDASQQAESAISVLCIYRIGALDEWPIQDEHRNLSRVPDYVIFLTTSHDIIFQWWSYTHNNSDQNLCWMWNFVYKIVWRCHLIFNVSLWPCPLCWVQHDEAHLNELTWHLTQHKVRGQGQGDLSIHST